MNKTHPQKRIDTPTAPGVGVSALTKSPGVSSASIPEKRHRILIVDDNAAIHDDFRKILLNKKASSELIASEAVLFGESPLGEQELDCQIDSAYQGQDSVPLVEKSMAENRPYTIAFVDVRMPPGWDGIETIRHLWKIDPRIQVVLCTAYSDYSWQEIINKLDRTDRLLILKKPFDIIEIHQLVCSLGEKWNLARRLEIQIECLEKLVNERTADLQHSFSMINATLEATADGILVVNQDGTRFNRRILEMWKIPAELIAQGDHQQILNLILSQIKTAGFLKQFQNPTYRANPFDFEVIKFPDGRVFECCAQPQTLEGNNVGTVWSFRDVTKRLMLENQLRQAQKMECVGQLAGGVAHDFNNMLTVIQGYAALLKETVNQSDLEAVEEIHAASQRAAALTRQLLAFSRRQVMQPIDIDLRQLISTSSRMLRPAIGENIQFEVHLDGTELPVHADAGMIEQILMNLAINAKDAMPDGGNFTIRAHKILVDAAQAALYADATPGAFILLEVSDTGSGISAANLPHIFEPFFTTKDVGKGTGLGLATVYGIVRQHKGWITVESTIGVGTTFKIYLPASMGKRAKPEIIKPQKSRGGSETILLVEDEAPVRMLAARILKDLGYTVLEAASAVKAIEARKKFAGDIHLLLTDMVMPDGMSGKELADEMKAANPNLKVIFTSGFSPELFGKAISLKPGFNFLQKPYPPEVLARMIRECLDLK